MAILKAFALSDLIECRQISLRTANHPIMLEQGIVGYTCILEIQRTIKVWIELVGNPPFLAAMDQEMLSRRIG
ncbi:hypothetical protein [Labrys sp. 22185]|uniref:hypothetical protein n=1 Tax=Labrys sp. 22185 TaxID=3453888 RepID=UPI003F8538F9